MTPSLAAEPPMVLMQLAQDAGPMGALSSFMPGNNCAHSKLMQVVFEQSAAICQVRPGTVPSKPGHGCGDNGYRFRRQN